MTKSLKADRLRELLSYDAASGHFTWLVDRRGSARAGASAGTTTTQGYRSIRIDGEDYQAHRLAFLHVNGKWPAQQVDHINGNRADNRFLNLRDVSGSTNQQNRRSAHRGKTLPLGVTWIANNSGKGEAGHFYARIRIGRRLVTVGKYATPNAAQEAYLAAKRQLHAGCTL